MPLNPLIEAMFQTDAMIVVGNFWLRSYPYSAKKTDEKHARFLNVREKSEVK
jgi:hypothetical protein